MGESARVFFFWAAALCLLTSGYNDSVDATAPVATAHALVDSGELGVRPLVPNAMLFHEGRNGAWYSKMGLVPTALAVPVVLAGAWLTRAGLDEKRAEDFLLSLVNPVLTAWLLALVYAFFRRRRSREESLWLTFALGAGTLLLPYSKSCSREPLQALCLVGAYTSTRPSRAGIWAAAALLTKHALFFPLIPLMAIHRREWRSFAPPLLAAAFVQGLYQTWAWGSPWLTGYGPGVVGLRPEVWRTGWIEGVRLQLFSTDKGLLFTAPLALLALFLPSSWSSSKSRALFAAAAIQLLLHARWFNPAGQDALGPRYLVAVLPLLWLALPEENFVTRLWFRTAVGAAVVSQLVFASVSWRQYPVLRDRAGEKLTLPHPAAQFRLFAHKLNYNDEIYDLGEFGGTPGKKVDLSDARSLVGFNYAAAHLRRQFPAVPAAGPEPKAVSAVNERSENGGADHTASPGLGRNQGT